MRPLSFVPGPAKIADATYQDIVAVADTSLLEVSHRHADFTERSKRALELLRQYLCVPDNYHIFFTTSATDAWHSMAANAVAKRSHHLINGAFSKKAYTTATQLYKNASHQTVGLGEACSVADPIDETVELITACYNESSSGVMMTTAELATLRENNQSALLAIDITSCAGAIELSIADADIWYFSVQKAFGLPAGLGILIVSDRAYQQSLELESTQENLAGVWQWSNFLRAQEKHIGQTPHTPNMFGIYLLEKQLERLLSTGLVTIASDTAKKATLLYETAARSGQLEAFVASEAHQSTTVVTLKGEEADLAKLHEKAAAKNIILGKGYGELKTSTIRIGNFPAHSIEDIEELCELFVSA